MHFTYAHKGYPIVDTHSDYLHYWSPSMMATTGEVYVWMYNVAVRDEAARQFVEVAASCWKIERTNYVVRRHRISQSCIVNTCYLCEAKLTQAASDREKKGENGGVGQMQTCICVSRVCTVYICIISYYIYAGKAARDVLGATSSLLCDVSNIWMKRHMLHDAKILEPMSPHQSALGKWW